MKVTLVNRDGSEVDLTERVQPLTYHIEHRMVLSEEDERAMEALRRDPHAQAQMRAVTKLLSLRMSSALFGGSEAWVQAQLTDADRAALAKRAEPVEWRLLPEARDL